MPGARAVQGRYVPAERILRSVLALSVALASPLAGLQRSRRLFPALERAGFCVPPLSPSAGCSDAVAPPRHLGTALAPLSAAGTDLQTFTPYRARLRNGCCRVMLQSDGGADASSQSQDVAPVDGDSSSSSPLAANDYVRVRSDARARMLGKGWEDSTMNSLIGRTGRVQSVFQNGLMILVEFDEEGGAGTASRMFLRECVTPSSAPSTRDGAEISWDIDGQYVDVEARDVTPGQDEAEAPRTSLDRQLENAQTGAQGSVEEVNAAKSLEDIDAVIRSTERSLNELERQALEVGDGAQRSQIDANVKVLRDDLKRYKAMLDAMLEWTSLSREAESLVGWPRETPEEGQGVGEAVVGDGSELGGAGGRTSKRSRSAREIEEEELSMLEASMRETESRVGLPLPSESSTESQDQASMRPPKPRGGDANANEDSDASQKLPGASESGGSSVVGDFDMQGARAIEIGNSVMFVKEDDAELGDEEGVPEEAPSSVDPKIPAAALGKVGFGSERVEVMPIGRGSGEEKQGKKDPVSKEQGFPEAYYRGGVSRACNYSLIPRPLYAPSVDFEVNPLASKAAGTTGIVLDRAARPFLYEGAAAGTAYDALWHLKGERLYQEWLDENPAEVRDAARRARLGKGSQMYPPGKKWYYNGVPLRKHRFDEDLEEWQELDEEEEDIEFSKTMPWGQTYIFPRNLSYGYEWFPDGYDERPTASNLSSLLDPPGREIRAEDIAHLPPLRQEKILDFSEGTDPDTGLSVVDLRFQNELLQAVNVSIGTDAEEEAVATFHYYMHGITPEMGIPALHEIPERIHNGSLADPIFADRICGQTHMMTMILADARLEAMRTRNGVPSLDPDVITSQPPACETCDKTACPLMQLRDAINDGSVPPLTRALEDADAQEAEGGVWVAGRNVVGVESQELAAWDLALKAEQEDAAARGMVEVGEEEGSRGFTTRHRGFETEHTLWYLRRLLYSMYVLNQTAPEGTWCGGREEVQELVSEVYGVDVHLHWFVPIEGNMSEVIWDWVTQSFYPRSTLPSGSQVLPPERPVGALHLCLCGNHFWAAAHDSDIWEANNFDLRDAVRNESLLEPLTDEQYAALPPEEQEAVVKWDRFNDPVVQMYFGDELPDNFSESSSSFRFQKDSFQKRITGLAVALENLLEDEDPYWLYMWNETFKAGLHFGEGWGDWDSIEKNASTGLPLAWDDPQFFDWDGYIEFRDQEERREQLLFPDGTSPPRTKEDLQNSIRKLQALYDRQSHVLAQEEAAATQSQGNGTGKPLASRRESLEILAKTISQWSARLGVLYPQEIKPTGDAPGAASTEGEGLPEQVDDNVLLERLAKEIGGVFLDFDRMEDEDPSQPT